MVSVIMVTYGHEEYIEEAINGVYIQQTDFPVELIIANDCSPDRTDEVIKELLNKAPENITVRYTRHSTNKGANANFIWATTLVKGKYIALCEGDDYWSDENKLQKQVDFLEAHPDYVLSYHRVWEFSAETGKVPERMNLSTEERSIDILELAKGNTIHTPSVVFRNVLTQLPEFMEHSPAGDYPLYLLLARHGLIHYHPELRAVYRKHAQSAWSQYHMVTLLSRWMKVLHLLLVEFKNEPAVHKNLLAQMAGSYQQLYERALFENEETTFLAATQEILEENSAFRRWWLENFYPTQLSTLFQYPAGIVPSAKHFLRQLKKKMVK